MRVTITSKNGATISYTGVKTISNHHKIGILKLHYDMQNKVVSEVFIKEGDTINVYSIDTLEDDRASSEYYRNMVELKQRQVDSQREQITIAHNKIAELERVIGYSTKENTHMQNKIKELEAMNNSQKDIIKMLITSAQNSIDNYKIYKVVKQLYLRLYGNKNWKIDFGEEP